MKKAFIAIHLVLATFLAGAQSWNPYVSQAIVTPAPLLPQEFGGTGELSVNVGNTGSSTLKLVDNQEMKLVITLLYGIPDGNPLSVLGGTWKDYFDWSYDPVIRTYTAIQNQDIPGSSQGNITILYEVTDNSPLGDPKNGFNVNLTPPPYTGGINPTGDDWIESYTYVKAVDWGDAPVASTSYGPADHLIDIYRNAAGSYVNYIFLGTKIDPEGANQPTSTANGDDLAGIDDEDGVLFPPLIAGSTVTIPVTVTVFDESIGWLNAWIDWNGDGTFAAGEKITPNSPNNIVSGAGTQTVNLTVPVPANAVVTSPTFARFRIGSNGGSSGSNNWGEVEDYQVTIQTSADLAINKLVSNATPNVGSNLTFTLQVTNNGPSNATNVRVNDLLPSGYQYVSDNGGGAYVSGTGVWTIGTLAGGASASLQIVATVKPTGTYANTAVVSGDQTDPVPGNNSDTETPVPVPQADLAMDKSVSNGTPLVGSDVIFTLKVTNNGPSAATGVTVVDPLPAGYQYVSHNGVGAYVSGTGVWTIGSLAGGASATLLITATVKATGPYANTAVADGSEQDPDLTNNEDSATPVPVPLADLAMNKTVNNSTPQVGETITFTLVVTNNGPSSATGVTVSDLLPAGYQYVSNNLGAAYNPGSGIWTAGSLAAGVSATLQITATVKATGPYANTAVASGAQNDPDPVNNTDTETTIPVPLADLGVVKTVSNPNPPVGSAITFLITATNLGPSAATGVTVNDAIPAGYTVNGVVPSVGSWAAPVWTIGALASGASGTLTVSATVNASGPYTNTATITGTELDLVLSDNISTVSPLVGEIADLKVEKVVDMATPEVGSTVTFTVTATNNGPSNATGVVVNDLLPSGFTLLTAIPSAGSWASPVWTVGTLVSGASASLQITATVNVSGNYTNTAIISGNQSDNNPSNNTASATVTPIPRTDLAIYKSVDNEFPYVGTTVTFRLTAVNNGPSQATGVKVTDLLPAGYSLVSVTASRGSWLSPEWNIGTLGNQQSATLDIVAMVNLSGPYLNTAVISGSQNDPNLSNNSDDANTTPALQADLAILKTADNMIPDVGSAVFFTIRVTNNGPNNATGVKVTDILPTGYTLIEAVPASGSWAAPEWTIGSLAAGSTVTMQIKTVVNITGNFANTARVSGTEHDPDLGNNSSTVTPVVGNLADLKILKAVSEYTPQKGSTMIFYLYASNLGPNDATGVVVTDVLPAGFTYVSDNQGGAYNPSSGVWTIGNLRVDGGMVTMLMTVRVNETGPYTNIAEIGSPDQTDPDPANNRDDVTVVPFEPDPAIALVKSGSYLDFNADGKVSAGDRIVYTFTVTNTGNVPLTNIRITDPKVTVTGGPLATLAVGASNSTTFSALYTITAADILAGSVSNQALATGTPPTGPDVTDLSDDTSTLENDPTVVPVQQQPAIALVKSGSYLDFNADGRVSAGDRIVYTFTVTNTGNVPLTNIRITDPKVTVTGGPLATLAVGASNSTTFSALYTITAADILAGSVSNQALATGTPPTGPDVTDLSDDTSNLQNDPTVVPVQQQPAIALVKSGYYLDFNADGRVSAGDRIVYTFTVTNMGNVPLTNIRITDPKVTVTGGPLATLAVGASNSTTFSALYTITAADILAGSVSNQALATGTPPTGPDVTDLSDDTSNLENDPTVVPVPVITDLADLVMSKTVSNSTPLVGSNVVFTLQVSNNGPNNATGVTVTDLIPTGYQYVSNSPGAAYNPVSGLWTVGSLAAGASATLQITAKVLASGIYLNTATASGAQIDPDLPNNTDTETTTPVPVVSGQTDLVMNKLVDNGTPRVGSNVIFTLLVTNMGPATATGVEVTDLLPSGYQFVSNSLGADYTPATGLWRIGTLANGATAVVHITATVKASGTYTNVAVVDGNEVDPVPGNNTDSEITVPVPQTDLVMDKMVSSSTPDVGAEVVFTLKVTNNGPSAATGVTVTDLLPSGYRYISNNRGSAYDPATGIWTIGNMAGGLTSLLEITATVLTSGDYGNTAVVSGSEPDPEPENNEDTEVPVPVPVADLSVLKAVSNETPLMGSTVTFSLQVSNNGPNNAMGVLVTDLLPSGYEYISNNLGAAYNPVTGVWTVGTLATGANAVLQITARVRPTGIYLNGVSVAGTLKDPDPGNNSDEVLVNPLYPPPVTVDEVVETCEDTPLSGNILANGDYDLFGNPLTVNPVLLRAPLHGVFIAGAQGGFTYTPTTGYYGMDMAVVAVCAGDTCSADSVFITVYRDVMANAGADVDACNQETLQFMGNPVAWAVGTWKQIKGPSVLTLVPEGASAVKVSGMVRGVYTLEYRLTNGACTDADTVQLTYWGPPVSDAGADAVICSTRGSYQLSGSAVNAQSVRWTTLGTGSFDNATALNAVYTPSKADIDDGQVQLILTSQGYGFCGSHDDFMVLTIWRPAELFAGNDAVICQGGSYQVPDAEAKFYQLLQWSHTGQGTLSGETTLSPVYHASATETGPVTLFLTATPYGDGECQVTTGSLELTFQPGPELVCPETTTYTFDAPAGSCGYTVPGRNLDARMTGGCGEMTLVHDYPGQGDKSTLEGATFPVGTTPVRWLLTDQAGNTSACRLTITVRDKQPPVFENCPEGQVLTVALFSGVCQGSAIWSTPVARDNCGDPQVVQTKGPVRGTVVPAGDYPVEYRAVDASGNEAFCRFTLRVIDTEGPIAVCPPDWEHAADAGKCTWKPAAGTLDLLLASSNCTFTVRYTVTGVTQATGQGDVSAVTFNPGVSNVSYSVKETASGQEWSCGFRVTVVDEESPVLTCPATITRATDPGQCTATVNLFAPQFADNCGGNPASVLYRIYHPDNSVTGPFTGTSATVTFMAGVSRVEWIMSDASGNEAECLQQVQVTETEMPVLTCPAVTTLRVDATPGECGYRLSGNSLDATATDNCGLVTVTHTYGGGAAATTLDGAFFPVGTTLVTWEARDASGNHRSCQVTVVVTDREAPWFVNCPSGKLFTISLFSDQCQGGAIWSIPVAMDNCSGVRVEQVEGPPQGSLLAVGRYTIGYKATDASGNTALCGFMVDVIDTELPLLACPQDITMESDPGTCLWNAPPGSLTPLLMQTNCPAEITWEVVNPDQSKVQGLNDVSGYAFRKGTSIVTYKVTETGSKQSVECNFRVTVTDGEAPVVACPAPLVLESQPGACDALVTLAIPQATDNCGLPVTGTYLIFHPDNSVSGPFDAKILTHRFVEGISRVEWTFTDGTGNTSTCRQQVTIRVNREYLVPDAGPDAVICEGNTFTLSGAKASHFTSLKWESSGSGQFSNTGTLNPVYTPGPADLLNGQVILTLTASSACVSASDEMVLTISGVPHVEAGADRSLCSGEVLNLTGATASHVSGVAWTTTGKGTLGGATTLTPVYTPAAGELGTLAFYLTGRGMAGCGELTVRDTLRLTIHPQLMVQASDDATILAGKTTFLSAEVTQGSGDYSYFWEPVNLAYTYRTNRTETMPLNQNTRFFVSVTDNQTGCSGTDTVDVTVKENIDDLLTIYNAVSPNGDGKNDRWIIDGIELFPENDVMIFNRWGDKITEMSRYDGVNVYWDGNNKDGKPVPDGVYYYVLRIRDIKDYTGWIWVKRSN